MCIDILPVPGGVGANEGFSVVMFRTIMQNQYVYPAMLLSRGVSFYALVIISALITIGTQISLVYRSHKQK